MKTPPNTEGGQAMQCDTCGRTSVVVPLKDKCPFCSPPSEGTSTKNSKSEVLPETPSATLSEEKKMCAEYPYCAKGGKVCKVHGAHIEIPAPPADSLEWSKSLEKFGNEYSWDWFGDPQPLLDFLAAHEARIREETVKDIWELRHFDEGVPEDNLLGYAKSKGIDLTQE